MSEFEMQGAPTIETISVEQAQMEPVEQRVGPMMQELERQGMTVHDFFGGNANRIEGNPGAGDWGQNDRGLESFIPPPPPVTRQTPHDN